MKPEIYKIINEMDIVDLIDIQYNLPAIIRSKKNTEYYKSFASFSNKKKKIDFIFSFICRLYEVPEENLIMKCRKREIVEPRQAAIFFLNRIGFGNHDLLADRFNLDRCTVIHSMKRFKELCEIDIVFKEKFNPLFQL